LQGKFGLDFADGCGRLHLKGAPFFVGDVLDKHHSTKELEPFSCFSDDVTFEIQDKLLISDEVDQWVEKTWQKYKVDILAFCSDWVHRFYEDKDSWPVSHRIKSDVPYWKYDYDYKQKSNLFNLNSLYRRISDKPFIKGKKQHLEAIMMYFWLHHIEGDEENYWQEYMSKISARSFQLAN